MNLQENIYRIKEVMGIINEQAQVETVSHIITQPYPNPNWDTVHGFSLKASDDDLEYNVGLKNYKFNEDFQIFTEDICRTVFNAINGVYMSDISYCSVKKRNFLKK